MPGLRVLQVSWEYPPVMYGGLGRHVHALSRALAARGHDVRVLTQGRPDTPADVPGAAGSPQVLRVRLGPQVPDVHADTAGFVLGLQDALVRDGGPLLGGWVPDVVHGHDWVVLAAASALARRCGAPLVMTLHATEIGLWGGWLTTDFSHWRASVERDLVTEADRTVVCSEPMRREAVEGLQADPDRVLVIPNGVDVAAWVSTGSQQAAARAAVGVPADQPMIVLVGRLEHEKGGQDAIAALARLPSRSAHLVLVGTGGQRDALAAQAAAAGLGGRVHLVGRLDDTAVAALLGSADVALVPSRYEPFGLVALEAMASGAPVVVARSGGLADIVRPGQTGLVVPPAAPAALAQAITALLDDPEGTAAMAARARVEAADRFGWDAVAQATAEVYSLVCEGATPA